MSGAASKDASRSPAPRVRDYYDRNTASFLRWGQGAKQRVIHRAVWGPGVHTRAQAFAWVHARIARELPTPREGALRLLDLGCGVGASLLALAAPGRTLEGITASPRQAESARVELRAQAGAEVHVGDFCKAARSASDVDLAWAIESFVHGRDPDAFFDHVATRLRPGARFVLVDDCLGRAPRSRAEALLLQRFRRGWRVSSLLRPEALVHLAARHGLRACSDERWTPWLELGRPRDRAIRLLVRGLGGLKLRHPRWGNLEGGDALQSCLRRGLLEYRCLVFEKEPA